MWGLQLPNYPVKSPPLTGKSHINSLIHPHYPNLRYDIHHALGHALGLENWDNVGGLAVVVMMTVMRIWRRSVPGLVCLVMLVLWV